LTRADVAIALSFEVSPFLREGSEFEFHDNLQIPFRLALNTPLISSLVRFSVCAEALRIHPAVASILDDMRFLLSLVLALPEKPSAKELQKVYTTSAWIHDRISSLPEDSPAARRPSAPSSAPSSRDSSAMPETREDQQLPQPGRDHPRPLSQQAQKQSRRASAQSPLTPFQDRSQATTPHSPPQPTPLAPTPNQPTPLEAEAEADYVYQAVRLAALLYSRAIKHRRPLSLVVTPPEFLRLWTTAWRVPLSKWRSLLGVLNWILLPLAPSGGKAAQPHDRFVKGMLNISLFQMGMDNWEIAGAVMEAGLNLQKWLAGDGREASASPSEGGGIERGGRGGMSTGTWREGTGSPGGGMSVGEGAGEGAQRRTSNPAVEVERRGQDSGGLWHAQVNLGF
jgi:hypothetical protein